MTYKTEGIILKYQDWQDYNRLYTFYTKDRGKLALVARGVRKIKSKQNGKLKRFAVLEVMAANGKRIDTLATAETIQDFSNLQNNLVALGLATFCTELVDQLTREGEKDLNVYRLLKEGLIILNDHAWESSEKMKALGWVFALRLIQLLGYGPDLYRCVNCQAQVKSPYNLAPQKGGLVCDRHAASEECVAVSEQGIERLRQVSQMRLSDFIKMPLEDLTAKQLALYIKHLISTHLEGELKSEKFLEKI